MLSKANWPLEEEKLSKLGFTEKGRFLYIKYLTKAADIPARIIIHNWVFGEPSTC